MGVSDVTVNVCLYQSSGILICKSPPAFIARCGQQRALFVSVNVCVFQNPGRILEGKNVTDTVLKSAMLSSYDVTCSTSHIRVRFVGHCVFIKLFRRESFH